jgi:hypothetical protein
VDFFYGLVGSTLEAKTLIQWISGQPPVAFSRWISFVVDWVEFDLESEDADTMDFFSRWL